MVFSAGLTGQNVESDWNFKRMRYTGDFYDWTPGGGNNYLLQGLDIDISGSNLYCKQTDTTLARTGVVQLSLSTPYLISSASYNFVRPTPSFAETFTGGIMISEDGSNLYTSNTTAVVNRYPLTTKWTISTIGTATYWPTLISKVGPMCSSTGSMYMGSMGSSTVSVLKVNTGQAWPPASNTLYSYDAFVGTIPQAPNWQNNAFTGLCVNRAGTRMMMAQYNSGGLPGAATPFAITHSINEVANSFSATGKNIRQLLLDIFSVKNYPNPSTASIRGIVVDKQYGKYVFVNDAGNKKILKFQMF